MPLAALLLVVGAAACHAAWNLVFKSESHRAEVSLGALGGTGAIPIINYPEVAILGVARGRQEAVVRDGQIVPRLLLPLSLTFDHRVADGADGARFASAIVRLLEHPDELLLEL